MPVPIGPLTVLCPAWTLPVAAARAGVALPTMSRIVDEIVRRGWAQRRVDQTDHRASVISDKRE